MKTYLFLFLFIFVSKISLAQQAKNSIDYQYFRDDNNYYAYELYKNTAAKGDQLNLNFTSNGKFKKIEKIYIKTEKQEFKLSFKQRPETISSDNPEFKFYPIIFNLKDIRDENIGCEAQILFKLDSGAVLKLPFNMCTIKEQLSKV